MISAILPRAQPAILLVRVDEALASLLVAALDPYEVLRVRHPLPARDRMAVNRPLVVVVGEEVRSEDAWMSCEHAQPINAEVVMLRPLRHNRPTQNCDVILEAVTRAEQRREPPVDEAVATPRILPQTA